MNALIPAYVYSTNFIINRVDDAKNLKQRMDDRGAGFVEYAALVVLAALVLGVIGAFLPDAIKKGISDTLTSIWGGGKQAGGKQ